MFSNPKVSWRYLMFMCGFDGWVLSFPLFGPVLEQFSHWRGVSAQTFVPDFLLCYSLAFVLWGLVLARWPLKGRSIRHLIVSDIIGCLLISSSLIWMPVQLWALIFCLLGLLSSLPPLIWLSLVMRKIDVHKIGWNLGVTGGLLESIIYLMKIITPHMTPASCFLLVISFLLIPLFIVLRYPLLFEAPHIDTPVRPNTGKIFTALFLLILVIYLVGGIMYQVVNPALSRYPNAIAYFGNLSYIVGMPLVGLLADWRGFRPLALFGMVGLGLGYTFFALSDSFGSSMTGEALLNAGFAFLDLLVLYVLTQIARNSLSFLWIGIGLSINIFSILAGVWLTNVILPLTGGTYLPAYLAAITILFVSFLFLEWIGKHEHIEPIKQDEAGKNTSAYYDQISEEMLMASQIQQNLLPKSEDFPADLEIAVASVSAREVGGDFYDVIPLHPNYTLFVIGDVMGKSIPAAIIVSSVVGQIRTQMHALMDKVSSDAPSIMELLQHLNETIIRDLRSSAFVTMGVALLDRQKQQLIYSSAGHLSPYLMTQEGVRSIELSSLPLGIDPKAVFEQVSFPFHYHDALLMYTDGLIETKNHQQELYGFERLERCLTTHSPTSSAEQQVQWILSDLRDYCGERVEEDDLTLLLFRKK